MKRSPLRAMVLVLALIVSFLQYVPATTVPAIAGGSPDISLTASMDGETLHGATTSVSLTAANTSGTNAFNLSFRVVLPAGVSYAGGDQAPTVLSDVPGVGETTLFFANVSDLPNTGESGIGFALAHDPVTYPVGSTYAIQADAYANGDPRILPKIASDGTVTDAPGFDDASASTEIVPFQVTKTEPSPEGELVRGLHDQQTVYTITVTQAPRAGSTGLAIEDWIPAGLEFLGCGGGDNSTVGEEFQGSGPIVVPPVADCVEPSLIETTSTGLPAGLPAGVYTRVVWDSTALGGAGIPAGGTFDISYAAAIPLFANTTTWANGLPVDFADQQRNIDNNNGGSTAETGTELAFTNRAYATATYSDDGRQYTDDGSHTVTSEDIAIHKTVTPSSSEIGTISTWTLTVRTSEYATSDGVTITDTVPDGLCPGATPDCAAAGPSTPYASAVEQTDGTWDVVWNLGTIGTNATTVLTYRTEQLAAYQENFAPEAPIRALDRWANQVELVASIGGTTVFDESSRSQSTPATSIVKEVAVPSAAPVTCGDGSGLSWDPDRAGLYLPGDRVCWRITLDTPAIFGGEQRLTDFLPPGFTYESWALGANNTVAPIFVVFDGSGTADGVLTWTFELNPVGDLTPPGTRFEAVISSIAGPPDGNDAGDLLGNLLKQSGVNSEGELYFDRDMAEAEWGEPSIALDKQATDTVIQAGQLVDFTITVENTGNVEALDVVVWDELPNGLQCPTVSLVSDAGTCNAAPNPDRIEWTVPSIAAGGAEDLTYRVTIPTTVGPRETYTNTAGVRTFETGVNTGAGDRYTYIPENNIDPSLESSANTDEAIDDWTLQTRNIGITKSRTTSLTQPGNNANGQATIGETVFFTVDVTLPEGTTSYDSPSLTDVIQAGYDYNGDAAACIGPAATPCTPGVDPLSPWAGPSFAADTITVSFAGDYSVPAGGGDELLRLTFSADVEDVEANVRNAVLRNRATIRWENSLGQNRSRNSNNANVRIVEPNITIDKTNDDDDGIVAAGQVLEWTLTVLNDDSVPQVTTAFDVVVTDDLPTGLTCPDVLSISDGGVCSGDVITWNQSPAAPIPAFAALNRGASYDLTFQTTLPAPVVADTEYRNEATVTGSSLPGAVAGERDSASPFGGLGSGYLDIDEDVVTAPRSVLTKSVDPSVQTIGELVRYTVEVTVPARVVQYDTTVIDMLPLGLVTEAAGYTVSATCEIESGGSCADAGFPIVVQELAPNGRTVGWFLGDQVIVPDESRTVTITYDARVEDEAAIVDGTVLTNQVNVYGNQSDKLPGLPPGGQVPDSPNYDVEGIEASADVTVREPNVSIGKVVVDGTTEVDARRAVPNEELTYRVTVTNDGNWPAHGIDVTDTITTFSGDTMTAVDVSDGTGYTVVDGDPTDGALAWLVTGPLAPSESVTIEYTLAVWDADASDENPTGSEIDNTASVDEYWAVPSPDPSIHRQYVGGSDDVEVELDLASVGDFVWFDVDGDGVQDAGEPGIPGVEVTVLYLGPDGSVGGGDDETFVTTTDAAGGWLVEDLPGGSYTVTVTDGVPSGLTESFDLDDGTTAPDGAWIGALAEDASARDVDFGYTGTGSIGDLVWFNRNGDGTQDVDEPGLEGVTGTVTFHGFDGTVGTADDVAYPFTTNGSGAYLVENLPAGDYTVAIGLGSLPVGLLQNYDPDGTLDSTFRPTLGAGEDLLTADFGYAGDSSIGDLVWLDENADGIVDPGEPGIENVDVELIWPGEDGVPGTPDDVTFIETTDATGSYTFVGLNPGDYVVTVDTATLPPGLVNTFDEDLDLDDSTDVTLPPATDHLTADFGYAGSGSIGDFVWWDLNRNGVQDPDEPGVPGVDLEVVWAGADGTIGTGDDVVFPTTTDSLGAYLVADLPAGEFTVTVVDPIIAAADNTFDLDGGGDSAAALTLGDAESNLDADFGYAGTGSIGDFVWYDVDGDGVQDAGEPGLEGVTVTLTYYGLDGVPGGGDDVVLTDVTAADGTYGFENLPAGIFLVDVDTGTLPGGMVPTADRDGTPDGRTEVTLAVAEVVEDADFGFVGTGRVGDTIWWDLDRDGTRQPGEPGWPAVDVTVTWFGVDGTLGTADDAVIAVTTTSDGVYVAAGLPAGGVRVELDRTDLPPDVAPTFDPDGGDDDRSDINLAAGGVDLDQDFGYAGEAVIGDFVWLDVDGDAVQDPSEPGAAGVDITVTWLGVDGVVSGDDIVVSTVATDADGGYLVGGLVAGAYVVGLDDATVPIGTQPNSDVDGGDPTDARVTLAPAESRLDVDFGLVGTATLDGVVWHDLDADGVRDPGEPGIPGATVTVTWRGPDGDISVDVITDADGAWVLTDIPSGDYTAVLDITTVPAGYVPTTPESVDVTVPPGGSASVEHGVVGGVAVGSLVWIDTDGDGQKDADESGIPGVVVEFIRDGVSTFATTDADGRYLFVGQLPGPFTVRLDPATIPNGLEQTYSRDGVLNLETAGVVAQLEVILDVNFGFQETELPVTGADLGNLAAAGVASMLLGLMLLLMPRRRRLDSR